MGYVGFLEGRTSLKRRHVFFSNRAVCGAAGAALHLDESPGADDNILHGNQKSWWLRLSLKKTLFPGDGIHMNSTEIDHLSTQTFPGWWMLMSFFRLWGFDHLQMKGRERYSLTILDGSLGWSNKQQMKVNGCRGMFHHYSCISLLCGAHPKNYSNMEAKIYQGPAGRGDSLFGNHHFSQFQ